MDLKVGEDFSFVLMLSKENYLQKKTVSVKNKKKLSFRIAKKVGNMTLENVFVLKEDSVSENDVWGKEDTVIVGLEDKSSKDKKETKVELYVNLFLKHRRKEKEQRYVRSGIERMKDKYLRDMGRRIWPFV